MGSSFSQEARDQRAQYAQRRAALTGNRQVTRREYESMMESYALNPEDAECAKLAEIAWNNGEDGFVYCDGRGNWHQVGVKSERCGLLWPIVKFSGVNGTSVMIYPEHTGGTIEKNPENPRLSKRDYCEWCAAEEGIVIHRTIFGPTGSIRPEL